MEPMTLGSPTGSPATAATGNLPGYLLGDPTVPKAPTFSPTKKTLSFANTSNSQTAFSPNSSEYFNRSNTVVGSPPAMGHSRLFKYHPNAMHDSSATAPPTIGLFDSLREEKNQTPSRAPLGQSMVDGGLNSSHRLPMSPIQNTSAFINDSSMQRSSRQVPHSSFWVTVFGFPASSVSTILSHFSQCGTIVDKSFPPQNGNWIHLRFSSRIESEKALNYNGKVIANFLMIGVLPCTDTTIINDAAADMVDNSSKLRSLSRVTYETTQSPTSVEPTVFAPKLNTGVVSKAMDLIFGW